MAEDLTTEQIVQKLSKHIPENLIDEVLSYYADLISYAASLNNDAWNISNRESGKRFQLNAGHMYILRSDEKKLLVMCDRDVVLSLSKDLINQLLSECTLKAYEDRKENNGYKIEIKGDWTVIYYINDEKMGCTYLIAAYNDKEQKMRYIASSCCGHKKFENGPYYLTLDW